MVRPTTGRKNLSSRGAQRRGIPFGNVISNSPVHQSRKGSLAALGMTDEEGSLASLGGGTKPRHDRRTVARRWRGEWFALRRVGRTCHPEERSDEGSLSESSFRIHPP